MGEASPVFAGVGGKEISKEERGKQVRGRSTIDTHFRCLEQKERDDEIRRDFRLHKGRLKRKRRATTAAAAKQCGNRHKQDQTIGITTQNVRGLAMQIDSLGRKLQGFKEQHARGKRAVIFIQETHLNPEEHDAAARQHVAMWGFKYQTAADFSFWSSGHGRRAGVAILVNPYGDVKKMQPWKREQWTEHLIMTTGELAGRRMLFINIYAPSTGAVRVQFFRKLMDIEMPQDCGIVCGGDFNCVLQRNSDRRGGTTVVDIGAKDLLRIVEKWNLLDAGAYLVPQAQTEAALAEYAQVHHTHFHNSNRGERGSSRLDRMYVSAGCGRFVRGVATEEAACKSDHRAVTLELHSPDGIIRVKKRPKVYPPPALAQAATRSLNIERLKVFKQRMDASEDGDLAARWGLFKIDIKSQMKKLTKEVRQRATQGWRQKIKRIKASLLKIGKEDGQEEERRSLLAALLQVQNTRRTLKRRVLVASAQWSAKATSKHFYRRICTKYGSNNILELKPTMNVRQRDTQDKANILRDSWEHILNGTAEEQASIADFVAKCGSNWNTVDLADLDDPITEAEVAAAIAACKTGKACGPDNLGNEWYKDHSELLLPILLKLFNECLTEGHTPASFLEAYIFSIGKGGDHTNPLNYRPIALLNSDYKIFTRILAWRVRRHVDKLVSPRQCGFVPGRTIHEVIDMLEAAKQICRGNNYLSAAQVLMLDFAKAYDSLDRGFLMEVLARKGFPPRILRIIQVIHANTTVQFLANGHLSEKLEVTSGIRQGCPLAPLLFIIAVDLLYDVVERDQRLQGIPMGTGYARAELKIAGYADDTAIYIQCGRMQSVALQLVREFSAVSGLRLNVKKSAAIQLRDVDAGEAIETNQVADHREQGAPAELEEVAVTTSTRYLGHIAGSGNTVQEAWTKAFAALRVRLELAEVKTNTPHQRAEIAAAIIVPKLLYVARHAWPTDELCKQTDQAIRNFVWRSAFRVPERSPQGWIQAAIADQKVLKGGVGIPNFRTELMAMSAMVVGDWALTTNPIKRDIGDVLQCRDTGDCAHLTTAPRANRGRLEQSLRATGKPWVEQFFRERMEPGADSDTAMSELRKELRHSKGLGTQWTAQGLVIHCEGAARDRLLDKKKRRRREAGESSAEVIRLVHIQSLWLGNSQGRPTKWHDYNAFCPAVHRVTIGDIVDIGYTEDKALILRPKSHELPLASRVAHQFREVCLCLLTNYPELVGEQRHPSSLSVTHTLADKHHVFEVGEGPEPTIAHSWGSARHHVEWQAKEQTAGDAVATFLKTDARAVRVAPHQYLTKMAPLWVGKRRWAHSRRQYKELMNRASIKVTTEAQKRISEKMHQQHGGVAKALESLEWPKIHRMEGATAYQTQNMYRLKTNRLRVWVGEKEGMQCQAVGCSRQSDGGTLHLVWKCPDAQYFWKAWLETWRWGDNTKQQPPAAQIRDIFGMRLKHIPSWLVSWGVGADLHEWSMLQKTAAEMWALGIAVTVTAIWRWNVDRVHHDGQKKQDIAGAVSKWRGGIREAYERYKWRLFPVTAHSIDRIRVAEEISKQWGRNEALQAGPPSEDTVRVGFFDGGSRGNPGPGGSGSVVVLIGDSGRATVEWAAMTALGGQTMTTNIAAFVGLHRLLTQAVSKGWKQLHVVGDSRMIIRMMTGRTPPKSKRLKPWYQAACRLADMCAVETWSHHYRSHNKMADWLANQAMDGHRSVMVSYTDHGEPHSLQSGIDERMEGDVGRWLAQREQSEKASLSEG